MFFSAEEGISQRRYFERGSVRISCNDLVVKLVLLPVVEKYRELYPNVNLSIVRTPPADVATALASGALDIAIEFNVDMGASVPDMSIVNVSAMRKSEISTQVLGTYIDVPMVGSQLAFLANAELAFQDLFEYPIIIPSMDTIARNYYMDKFKQYRISRGPDIEASGPERRILFTERNMGISFMPEECVRSEINERRLFPLKLKEKLLERNLLMMTNKVKPLSNAARAFSYMLI
jgi:DNA-binding transcriptional LysR family regulator